MEELPSTTVPVKDRFLFTNTSEKLGALIERSLHPEFIWRFNLPGTLVHSVGLWKQFVTISLGNGVELYLPGGRCEHADKALMRAIHHAALNFKQE